MRTALRLTAALLAGLALPALAQTPATRSTTPAPVTAPPSSRAAAPAASAPAATPSGAVPSTPGSLTRSNPPAAATAPGATSAAAASRSAVPAASGAKIDINSASANDLDTLPGIGPALANQIIAGRPWDDLNDLVKKKALPQGVFDRNKDRLALANINTSSAADMAKTLPGIGDVRARAIVNGRPYTSPQDLVSKKVLSQGVYNKVKDVVAY